MTCFSFFFFLFSSNCWSLFLLKKHGNLDLKLLIKTQRILSQLFSKNFKNWLSLLILQWQVKRLLLLPVWYMRTSWRSTTFNDKIYRNSLILLTEQFHVSISEIAVIQMIILTSDMLIWKELPAYQSVKNSTMSEIDITKLFIF